MKRFYFLLLCMVVLALASLAPAQTFDMLVSFDAIDGAFPNPLVQGRDGNYYGTTSAGGVGGGRGGAVFKADSQGKLTTLYSFCSQINCADGSEPLAGLVLATDGNFYGTTSWGGGTGDDGTIFKITPAGTLTTLHTFCPTGYNCSDGATPTGGLVQGTDGNFYGTTRSGGIWGGGTVFKITPMGKLTELHRFCVAIPCTEGEFPDASLIQATDGNFYGTTSYGGAHSGGTVFKITPKGRLTTLYSFCAQNGCADGDSPNWLLQAADGNFYGTAGGGIYGWGAVFKITSKGKLTTLYSFPGNSTGTNPTGLIQATDGLFYGTAQSGGILYYGTIFQFAPDGRLTTLHDFDGNHGGSPFFPVLQATSGVFYGTTQLGGSFTNCGDTGDYYSTCGTVFSLDTDLGPFVAFVRNFGKVGAIVQILGQGFTGTTSVLFNGVSAKFAVHSDTYLTANVPEKATTGYVKVATPNGTLQSNVKFRVFRWRHPDIFDKVP